MYPFVIPSFNFSLNNFVTSQFSIWMLYIGHHMHTIFYLRFGCDPRNLKQLKDPRRELEVSQIFIFEFFQIWKEDNFDFNLFSPNFSNNKWEKIIWLLQQRRNIGEENFEIKLLFYLNFICYFIRIRENMHFWKLHF